MVGRYHRSIRLNMGCNAAKNGKFNIHDFEKSKVSLIRFTDGVGADSMEIR